MAKEIKKFVKIHSDINVSVTPGLQLDNVTNPDAHVPDRLNVAPTWPKVIIDVRVGAHFYPSEIAEWNTVKALCESGVMSIIGYSDECQDEITKEQKNKLDLNEDVLKSKYVITKKEENAILSGKKKKSSLEEMVEE